MNKMFLQGIETMSLLPPPPLLLLLLLLLLNRCCAEQCPPTKFTCLRAPSILQRSKMHWWQSNTCNCWPACKLYLPSIVCSYVYAYLHTKLCITNSLAHRVAVNFDSVPTELYITNP